MGRAKQSVGEWNAAGESWERGTAATGKSHKEECPGERGQRPGWECSLRIGKDASVAKHSEKGVC